MYVMEKIKEQKPKLVSNVEKANSTKGLSLIKLDDLPTDPQARASEIKKLNDQLKAEQLKLSETLKAIKKEETQKAKEEARKAKEEEARKEFEKTKEAAKAEFAQKEPDFLKLEERFLKLKEQYSIERKKMNDLQKIFDAEFNNNRPSTNRPGVIDEIRKCITDASPDGISKPEILNQLIAAFPERSPEAMKKTINAQLPSRIENNNFNCVKMDNGNYKVV